MKPSFWVLIGAVLAFLGVALGAFGAHALRGVLDERDLAIYQTGVQYQMIHALALIAVGLWLPGSVYSPVNAAIGWCFLAGVLIFSGSLYALVFSGVRVLGAITPIGGVSFLAGWALLAISAWRTWATAS